MKFKKVKIVVMVPEEAKEMICDFICDMNVSKIGNYDSCMSILKVKGLFRPNEEANPYVGEKGRLEQVDEYRIEFICAGGKVLETVDKLRDIHPYEEPEIDIIPLLDKDDIGMREAKVITICGSLRFQKEIMEVSERLEFEGNCVLSLIYPTGNDKDSLTEEQFKMLGELHMQKIRMCDAIYVVNVNGYIGEAVKKEIAYAKSLGKEIMYLEEISNGISLF